MKINSALFALGALCTLPVLGNETTVHGDPYIPIGTLDVNKTWVQTGMRPTLTWNIRYPETVDDIIEITPEDKIVPKERTEMEIRVVGAAFQVGSNHTPLAVQTRVGSGSSWESIFLGADHTVNPSEVLYSQVVEEGVTIDFSSRAQRTDGSWYSSRDTLTENLTVTALKNGDSVPYYVPAYEQGDIASFLTQYISADNKITIGPRDVIYLYELYSTNSSSSYFDMQDMVVLVTFKDVEVPQ